MMEVKILGQLEKEESTFLSLCSPHDYDLLTGCVEMTLQDFERITYLTMALDYVEYSLALQKRYTDFTNRLAEQLERENQFLTDNSAYYLDEDLGDNYQKWIDDFCRYIPADKRKFYHGKLHAQTEFR